MQREDVQLSPCWTFLTEYCYCEVEIRFCSPFNTHTEEEQLAEDMQEDEREADDELLVSTICCYCWN